MSILVTQSLIDKIKALQEAEGLSETDFARRLGMSRANWFLIKKGERQLTNKFLSGVMGVFPQLTVDILDYMRGSYHGAEN